MVKEINVGDRFICVKMENTKDKKASFQDIIGREGTVIKCPSYRNGKLYRVKLNGDDFNRILWDDEFVLNVELNEKIKIEKEKLRLCHIDIDPFGEENWIWI